MRVRIPNGLVSVTVIVALTPWRLGCATGIHRQLCAVAAAGEGNGRSLVSVFEARSERRRELDTRPQVVTEPCRVEGRSGPLVRQARGPCRSVSDLPPGNDEVQANGSIDDRGDARALPFKYKRTFVIRVNETAAADVVLADACNGLTGVVKRAAFVAGAALWLGHEARRARRPFAGGRVR